MSKLFGKAKKQPQVSSEDQIQKLRDQLDVLEKKETHLQKKADMEEAFIKKNASKNKKAALAALRRKKGYEKQIGTFSGARYNIEMLLSAIDSGTTMKDTFDAMKVGTDVLVKTQANVKEDDVLDMQDAMNEALDAHEAIAQVIGQPMGAVGIDDDELMAELEGYQQQEIDEAFAGKTPAMPDVGTGEPVAAEAEEDDDFAELERSMAV